MEIEKLNDNQLKFILSKGDLVKRDLKIAELAYGSEKTQELFRDMMAEALVKFDFHSDSPLMIEAIPTSTDTLVILVTKVTNPDEIEERFSFFAPSEDAPQLNKKQKTRPLVDDKPSNLNNDSNLIYSFDSLDDIISLSKRFNNMDILNSSVFKLNGRYYLTISIPINNNIKKTEASGRVTKGRKLSNADTLNKNSLKIENLLSEYGTKHFSNSYSKHFLLEHGEVIILSDALTLLKKYL